MSWRIGSESLDIGLGDVFFVGAGTQACHDPGLTGSHPDPASSDLTLIDQCCTGHADSRSEQSRHQSQSGSVDFVKVTIKSDQGSDLFWTLDVLKHLASCLYLDSTPVSMDQNL